MHHQTRTLISHHIAHRGHRVRTFILLCALCVLCGECANPQVRKIDDAGITRLHSHPGIVVINFWATWCVPCVEEMPVFKQLHAGRKDVVIYGISLDEANQLDIVRKFVGTNHIAYPIYLRDGKGDFEAMVNSIDSNWIGAIPATFIYKDGKRIFSKSGPISQAEIASALPQ